MATEMHWYDGGVWKKALEMHVWDAGIGQWREALQMYIWDETVPAWRLCHVTPNCFPFFGEYVNTINDCAGATPLTFHASAANPQTAYTSVDVFIYGSSGCGSNGIGAAFVQLDIAGTLYNFETNASSKVIDAALVTC
jgi:hypothetical protein